MFAAAFALVTTSERHNGPYFGIFTSVFAILVTLVASQPGHVFLGTTVRASAMPAFVCFTHMGSGLAQPCHSGYASAGTLPYIRLYIVEE